MTPPKARAGPKRPVRLICWNVAEADDRAARLRAAGYRVEAGPIDPAELRAMRDDPPLAVVIDLSRLPSHGRDVAVAIRMQKGTRQVPLVFVEGAPDKKAAVMSLLPDAGFTTWGRVRGALARAIAHPPSQVIVPRSGLDGYSGTPLPKKLGVKPDATVALVGAPRDFAATLGELPAGARLRAGAAGGAELIVWFVRSLDDLKGGIGRMGRLVPRDGLWIAWPKKASALASDLGERDVREAGLASGLVDYKICAIDATWSGLRFARRKERA